MGNQSAQSIRVFVAGDSTAAQKLPAKRPESGWAEHLGPYLKSGAVVCNRAVNGRSTKSFLEEGRFSQIEEDLQPGDYVLIQFGHNDGKEQDPARYTDPWGKYRENLCYMIRAVRERGATPVMLTSLSRRRYEGGVLQPDTVGEYPAAAREAAREEAADLLDLYAASWEYLRDLGEKESASCFLQLGPGEHENYPQGVLDNTHFNVAGARRMAALFVRLLGESACPLKEWLA